MRRPGCRAARSCGSLVGSVWPCGPLQLALTMRRQLSPALHTLVQQFYVAARSSRIVDVCSRIRRFLIPCLVQRALDAVLAVELFYSNVPFLCFQAVPVLASKGLRHNLSNNRAQALAFMTAVLLSGPRGMLFWGRSLESFPDFFFWSCCGKVSGFSLLNILPWGVLKCKAGCLWSPLRPHSCPNVHACNLIHSSP